MRYLRLPPPDSAASRAPDSPAAFAWLLLRAAPALPPPPSPGGRPAQVGFITRLRLTQHQPSLLPLSSRARPTLRAPTAHRLPRGFPHPAPDPSFRPPAGFGQAACSFRSGSPSTCRLAAYARMAGSSSFRAAPDPAAPTAVFIASSSFLDCRRVAPWALNCSKMPFTAALRTPEPVPDAQSGGVVLVASVSRVDELVAPTSKGLGAEAARTGR
nr:proline-rich protein 18-like [Aegilops tauschii subsp. strangulata]